MRQHHDKNCPFLFFFCLFSNLMRLLPSVDRMQRTVETENPRPEFIWKQINGFERRRYLRCVMPHMRAN